MPDLEKEFDADMLGVYRSARIECNSNAGAFFQMLSRHRGLESTHRLLAAPEEQSGFTELYLWGSLHLTVECLVLKRKYRPFFSVEELEVARKRLHDRKFDPSRCET